MMYYLILKVFYHLITLIFPCMIYFLEVQSQLKRMLSGPSECVIRSSIIWIGSGVVFADVAPNAPSTRTSAWTPLSHGLANEEGRATSSNPIISIDALVAWLSQRGGQKHQ